MQQRRLLFDSLTKFIQDDSYLDTKIVKKGDNKSEDPAKQGNRGTYVFSWGAGYHGQLGRRFARGEKKYAAIPMMIKDLDIVIRQVSCGGLHSAFVSEYGRVYTWGDGRSGQLGHTDDPSVKQQVFPSSFISRSLFLSFCFFCFEFLLLLASRRSCSPFLLTIDLFLPLTLFLPPSLSFL